MASIDLLPKCEEIKAETLKTFGRTIECLNSDIESIKEWAKKQPHLPELPSDERIISFLIVSKFEFAKAKKMIDMYYTIKGILPEFYKDPEAPEVLNVMELMYWIPLPNLTSENSRILMCKLRKRSEDQQFDSEAFFAMALNLIEILILEDPASSKIFVFDGANLQIEHIASISPLMAKKAYHAFEEVHISNLHQMHLVNVPSLMEPILALLKSFMKPKISEKIIIHKSVETLFDYIPKENLTQDYGGKEESLETLHELWKSKIREIAPMIRKQQLLKTDESKRLEESALDSELLGLEGNFRKLNVD